jgi:hypothetical protein
MNGYLIAAGLVSAFQFLGHVTAGARLFLQPMLGASFDVTSKRTHFALFHYVGSLIFLSSAALLYLGWEPQAEGARPLVAFLAAQNAVSGIIMILVAATSGIEGGVRKMFGWAFHFLIAALAIAGIC